MSATWGNIRSQQRRAELNRAPAPPGLKRGIRNGLLMVTPFWLLLGRVLGWW
jgi:hypothetical protein